jgi:dextranase
MIETPTIERKGDDSRRLESVRCFYRVGEPIVVGGLPEETVRVIARNAVRGDWVATVNGDARFDELPAGTYSIEALSADKRILAEELTTVGRHQGERPVHGFATSFRDEDISSVVEWNRLLRSTVVQVYDWMASYTEPLGSQTGWKDPSNRDVSFEGLRSLAMTLAQEGAVAHAYAPIYAVGNEFARDHPEMLMYEGSGEPVRFLDQIVLANPGNEEWQELFEMAYGAAIDAVGFTGLHIDTYGYPRIANDVEGNPIDLRGAYESFLRALRTKRPNEVISFNQVNGVPSAAVLAPQPNFRYCEIWPPNSEWRHFEGLLDRSSGDAGQKGLELGASPLRGSIACYPPVWGVGSPDGEVIGSGRESCLRTDVATDAVATMLGASALIFGDKQSALCDPYYPKHAELSLSESQTVLSWRRFSLRCRDLFFECEDTSWYEIGDENGVVSVTSAGAPVSPEPCGQSVFARVMHADGLVAVGVLDLTGSSNGRWSEATAKGNVSSVTVTVLVDDPATWRAEAAVLGLHDDRFSPIDRRVVAHRQGSAVEIRMPVVDGWSVLRLKKEKL